MATQPGSTTYHHLGIWDNSVPNQSPKLVIVSIIFFVLSTLTIIARFAWRWAHLQRGWDDVMALCAYITLLIMTVFGFLSADFGFGKPSQYILPTIQKALEYFFLYQICYKLLGGFTKLTFCFLYLRIFPQRGFRNLVIATAVIIAAGSLAFALGTVFQCLPVERAWNRTIPGTCTSNMAFWYSHAAFNTFMDIVIYIMPIPMIRTLKLARGQKTGLISIFCLGAFVIAASIVRMVALRASALTNDPTWGSLDALTWTEIEGNTSVICCCMPALRVPVISFISKMFSHAKRAATPSPRSDEKPEKYQSAAWAGPHRSSAHVLGGMPTKPSQCYHTGSGGSSQTKSDSSVPSTKAETWYERALRSIGKDTDIGVSRSSSQEDLARSRHDEDMMASNANTALPEVMELGAIYKTTDLHVSTSDLGNKPARKQDRGMSLADFLRDG